MSDLRAAVSDYLALRRSLGYALVDAGRLLPAFVNFLHDRGATHVTTDLAVAWATAAGERRSALVACNASAAVRGFAWYLQQIDPAYRDAAAGPASGQSRPVAPYVYSDTDIAALMAATRTLNPPLRAATYQTLIGLLLVTGLRIGEAIALDRDDVTSDTRQSDGPSGQTGGPTRSRWPTPTTSTRWIEYEPQPRDRHLPRTPLAQPAGLDQRHPTVPGRGARHVPHPAPPRRVHRRWPAAPHPDSRPETQLARCTPSSTGTVTGPTWTPGSRCCRACSVTSTPPPPTGTCRRHRSCSPPSPAASTRSWRDTMSLLAPTLQAFFTDRLATQRHASPATVTAYRDTFRLLLRFVTSHTGTTPSRLTSPTWTRR